MDTDKEEILEMEQRLNWLRIAILALAIVFIVLGAFRGEVEMIFTKAIRICQECIGIG